MTLEEAVQYAAEHIDEIPKEGLPRDCFRCPLALYLSKLVGGLVAIGPTTAMQHEPVGRVGMVMLPPSLRDFVNRVDGMVVDHG